MRLIALFPLLCVLVSFIISLLCIFAGSKINYLENANLLTLNTSMLGQTTFNTSSSSSSFLNSIEGTIKGGLNTAISDVARDLNIHDFYSAHVLDYCEGYFTPGPIPNATDLHPHKNVTHCSNRTSLFHFDPTAIIQSELKAGVNLSELHWPSAIEDAVHTVELASKAMFVLYCIGAAAAGVALLAAVWGLIGGKGAAMVNMLLDLIGFFALGIASAIATAISVKVVKAVNEHGNDIGVEAYKGNTFIGMTWAATVLLFVAAVGWLVDCCGARRRDGRLTYMREGKEGRI